MDKNSSICNSTQTCPPPSLDRIPSHGVAAGVYVIVVIIFYGTSVMFLIASHIKRKREKIAEDRQINSYLKEFQIVRDSSSKDNYRTLKKNMIAYLSKMGVKYGKDANTSGSALYRCLSKTLIPMTAFALSPAASSSSLTSKKNSPDASFHLVNNRVLQVIDESEELNEDTEDTKSENISQVLDEQVLSEEEEEEEMVVLKSAEVPMIPKKQKDGSTPNNLTHKFSTFPQQQLRSTPHRSLSQEPSIKKIPYHTQRSTPLISPRKKQSPSNLSTLGSIQGPPPTPSPVGKVQQVSTV